MAFLRARASWFRAKTWVAHAHSVPPSTSLPRVTLPTLELSDHLHRVPRLLSGEMEAHPSTQRIARFPLDTLPSRSPTSSETVCEGKTSGPGAWTGDFPGDSLRARRSLSPGECPRRPLTPRRTPDSRDKRPSNSMGLGHLGQVCEQQAYEEANQETPPARTHHCEDPPFLPSVKGSSLRSGGTWGGPQEVAFLRAAAAWFRTQSWAAHGDSGSPPQASLRSRDPP